MDVRLPPSVIMSALVAVIAPVARDEPLVVIRAVPMPPMGVDVPGDDVLAVPVAAR